MGSERPDSASFPKSTRLLNANDFVRVLRRARINVASGPLRVRAIANRMRCARLGLVVSKRGNALAVRRNRIKRILRETFRHERAQLPPLDLVVQVHGQMTDDQLRQQFRRLLARVVRENAAAMEDSKGKHASDE